MFMKMVLHCIYVLSDLYQHDFTEEEQTFFTDFASRRNNLLTCLFKPLQQYINVLVQKLVYKQGMNWFTHYVIVMKSHVLSLFATLVICMQIPNYQEGLVKEEMKNNMTLLYLMDLERVRLTRDKEKKRFPEL
jgi:hypothetical protein